MKKEFNRNFIAIACSFALLLSIGCSRKVSSIEGEWIIDLERMTQQAESLNASQRDINAMKKTFSDGRLEIDSKRITMKIEGVKHREVHGYTVSSVQGACSMLLIQPSVEPLKHCLNDGRLEIHDPSTPLIVVYRRI